jgi:myo-inositol-1(or 4)-monophosphatase
MGIESIASIVDHVREAAAMALRDQQETARATRGYKDDGSILTATDQKVEDYLYGALSGLYPEANILTEETSRSYDPARPYTFAVDPIDGTDVYSQGMAGWCVSVGLLDGSLRPIAGVLYAPSLHLWFIADIGRSLVCPGHDPVVPREDESLDSRSALMVSSRIHRHLDMSRYPGKVRSIGSAALHLFFPLIYPQVVGAIQQRGVYVWDIAAAHAINRACGLELEYYGGQEIAYAELVPCSAAPDAIISGSDFVRHSLRTITARRQR